MWPARMRLQQDQSTNPELCVCSYVSMVKCVCSLRLCVSMIKGRKGELFVLSWARVRRVYL